MDGTVAPPLNDIIGTYARRGMENFVAASAIWSRAAGGPAWSYPGIHCFATTVPRRAFNQMIIEDVTIPADRDLREAIERFGSLGLRYRVRMRDIADGQMRPRLESLGLEHRGGIPAMVLDRSLLGERPTSLTIAPVNGLKSLGHHVEVVARAFDWEPGELARVFRTDLVEEPDWRGWVGYEDGFPVAASQLVTHERTGGIYYVAVLDTHRRKGYGEAVTRIAVESACSNGCDLATLNASPHGYPVYKRLGFRDAGQHVGYVPTDADAES